jgi:hypothetical protein
MARGILKRRCAIHLSGINNPEGENQMHPIKKTQSFLLLRVTLINFHWRAERGTASKINFLADQEPATIMAGSS